MQPPDELRDSSRAAGWLNKLLAFSKSNQLIQGIGYRLHQTTRGTALEILPGTGGKGATSEPLQRFFVLSNEDDYLECRRIDENGTAYGEVVFVAKPRTLRVSVWQDLRIGDWSYSGNKTNRYATYVGTSVPGGIQSGDKIGEVLHPPWESETELIASKVTGKTGVLVTNNDVTERIEWIDLNADARRYVSDRDRVDVCKFINGVETPKRIVIDGGPVF